MTQTQPPPGWFLDPVREEQVREWAAKLGASTSADSVGPYSALCDALAEIDRLRQHVDELQSKVMSTSNGQCCCSFDSPGDVCMVHSPTVDRLRAELDGRRAQALREGAAKLLELAKVTPYNARAAGLAFSAGVLDQMAEPDPAPTTAPAAVSGA